MESDLNNLFESLSTFWVSIRNFAASLIQPSRILQVAVVFGCLALAWLTNRWIGPRFEAWMRGLEGRPKWQLRGLLILHRRFTLLFFAMYLWLAAFGFAQIYAFPSRRYLLVLIATIATVWFLIRIVAQIVRNRFLRQLIIWGLSVYAVLYYLGFLEEATAFLDSLAIELGSFRLSSLAILKAIVVTGLLFAAAGLISRTTAQRLRANPDISPSMQELAIKALQIILFSAAFFIGLKAVGFDLTGLAVLSGAIEPPPIKWSAPIVRKSEDRRWRLRCSV